MSSLQFTYRNIPVKCLLFLLFLSVPAPGDGLPGEFLLSSRWRDLMWYHSPLNNPAYLPDVENKTFRAAISPVLQGAFTLSEVGFTVPVLQRQAAGVSLIMENDGKVGTSRLDETANRLVMNESTISNRNFFGILSYSLMPLERLSTGININVAHQTNFGESQTGVGLDLGVSWRILPSNDNQNHLIGLSTINLIAPVVGSDNGSYSRDLKASWIADFKKKSIETGIEADLRDFWARMDDFKAKGVLAPAARKELEWGISGRAGYWIMNTFGVFGQIGFDNRVFEYLGFAAGVRKPLSKEYGSLSAFYQYNIKTEGDLASSHTFYLFWSFGKSRKDASKKQIDSTVAPAPIDKLKKIRGVDVKEEKEYIRITATQVAVNFASGSAELPTDAIPVLREITDFLRHYPDHPVIIEGHTDNDPITGKLKMKFSDNTALSQARCQAVKDFFVQTEELPEKWFTAIGYGETRPVAPNDTKENKRKNRRVLVIVKK
jgi:flagellar motor protein MotB